MSETKPSVAICFSGLPKLKPLSVPKWQRFIEENEADVFIHTWEEIPRTQAYLSKVLCEVFKPKALKIEPVRKFNIDLFKDSDRIWPYRSHPSTVLSMWYSIRNSIEICEEHARYSCKSYDIVCRARFDWLCDHIELGIRPGLTVPDDPGLAGHRFTYCGERYIAHNDQFGYGNMEVMGIYARTAKMMPMLFIDCGVDFCSELFLTANMIRHGIPIHYQTQMNYRIER